MAGQTHFSLLQNIGKVVNRKRSPVRNAHFPNGVDDSNLKRVRRKSNGKWDGGTACVFPTVKAPKSRGRLVRGESSV